MEVKWVIQICLVGNIITYLGIVGRSLILILLLCPIIEETFMSKLPYLREHCLLRQSSTDGGGGVSLRGTAVKDYAVALCIGVYVNIKYEKENIQ